MEKPPVCQYYVERKKRFCKFQLLKGSEYCRIHTLDNPNRMLCPFEKDTYINISNYEAHLKICPKFKEQLKQENSQWFTKNINQVQNETLMQQQISIREVADQPEFQGFVQKLLGVFFEVFGKEPQGPWYYIDLTKEVFQEPSIQDKDQIQCDLILGLVLKYNLKSLENIYVEFGAGKGLLSSTIAKAFTEGHSKHVLLEMEARRNKADMFHRDNPFFHRFRSNVGDFNLAKIKDIMVEQIKSSQKYTLEQVEEFQKELAGTKLVGVCKHMCGMATDLSISSMMNASLEIPIGGAVLATCCHHKCSYETFQNINFFKNMGFTPQETSQIFKVSSWGVMRTKQPPLHATLTPPSFLEQFVKQKGDRFNESERQVIGKVCKRLIDKGRVQLLKEFQLQVEFVKYCDYEVTPQNFALICYH